MVAKVMLHSPIGTLTFLMTDIEGSTRMWEENPDAMGRALVRHEAIIREMVAAHDGYNVAEQGEGDSTLSVFKNATHAAQAALAIREALALERWPAGVLIRVRIGLHSGVADMRQETYYGRAVNRAARVRGVAHGGQIVLTRATKELLDAAVFPTVKDHGHHRLKDLLQPEHLFELPTGEQYPPLKTLNQRPTNLPIQLTSFVGRTKDIDAVRERLGHSRLVTLVGTGGCGKTRLSLQVAAEASDAYPDGIYFVDLTTAHTLDDVNHGVLRAARVESVEELSDAQALFILDNCEHLVEAASAAVKALLIAAPSVSVLATSRESLRLRAEVSYRVPPLSLPAPADLDALEAVEQSEAVQLFVERAQAKVPGFALTSDNCRPIGEICRKLDGLALAIELAAPRLKLLTAPQLLERLSERFSLLKDKDRTEANRHRTLLATIDHSYDLLTPSEQK